MSRGRSLRGLAALLVALGVVAGPVAVRAAPRSLTALGGRPDATIDLRTAHGVALVKGAWRYQDARVVPVDFPGPGPDLRASGPPVPTLDIEPRAGVADFDDSGWPVIEPAALEARRGPGRLAFSWYRIAVTIPERIEGYDPTGATVVFEIVVDDYAEVWVDGRQPRALGQAGGSLIGGFNAPNRVVLARDARPGQRFQVAVFGANGPLSDPPPNFIWVRSSSLDFFRPRPGPLGGEIERRDPGLDAIVPAGARVERLAEGFSFTEGPVWMPDGGLLFSDPDQNTIYRYGADEGTLSVFRVKSGYAGGDIADYRQPGSNGLTLDREGRVTIAEHGRRRVVRLERTGAVTVLADRYQGRRLNSPNDLVYRSDGVLYFTDPFFGLPRVQDDPRRELAHAGVYAVIGGEPRLLVQDLAGPNGLAFSPDERFLYVGNWDSARKVVMRYPVRPDGLLGEGQVFIDMTGAPGRDAVDGIKVDLAGNLYVSGPGGLWILAPDGRHLGTVKAPEHPHNLAWGDADGRTLYLTAETGLYRLRLAIPGIHP